MLDAKAVLEQEKKKTLEPTPSQLVIPPVPKRGTLGRTVRLKSGRIAAEDEVTDKNPTRAKEALLGKYRISTVRRYRASWQRFREWADDMGKPGQRPNSVTLVDYMYAREEEGMGPSIPLAVSAAVSWFERTSGTPEEEQIMCRWS